MRRLILHRERALACFAMKYHCIVNREREAFLRELAAEEQSVHLWDEAFPALRNGQTVSLDIGEGESRFFVVACLDGRDLATQEAVIPPGEEDVYWTVLTDYDGNKRLGLRLAPAEHP